MTNKDIQKLEAIVAAGDAAEAAWINKAPLKVREDAFGNYDLLARKSHSSLKAMLDHVKEQEQVMQDMAEALREVADISDGWYDGDIAKEAEQALTQFENMKKEK